jgi:Uma2 family endonuclease
MVRLFPGLVRVPDAAFVSWARVPGGRVPAEPVPDLVPDLVVEVLAQGNTPGEMARKLGEYFAAGVRLAWLVDPDARTVTVHGSPLRATVLSEAETLDGGDVLPGFTLPLGSLFAVLDRQATP